MLNERKLTKSELAKREDIIMKMKDNKRALVQKYGKDAEAVMYGRATNLAKKKSEGMDQDKIKELVKDALQNPKKADLNKDGKLSDYEEKRGAAIEKSMANEDLDLGHQDNEPHMLKADLYRIGKYAMELYQMVDEFEAGSEEVDFPHWWQAKIINAKDAIVGAKHYLDFELKEPQIDAMVDVAQDVEAIDEAKFTDYSNNELAAYCKNNPEDKAAAAELKKRSQKLKDLSRTDINEGVWSLGTSQEIKDAIHTLETWYESDARQISALFDDPDNENWFYNVVGDDVFHDYLNRIEKAAAVDDADRAHNAVGDAIGRAEELLAFVQKREGLNEEEAGEADMVASDIQKAMNATKGDEAKTHQLKQARIAMNKGDLDKAKKIADRIAKQLKSK